MIPEIDAEVLQVPASPERETERLPGRWLFSAMASVSPLPVLAVLLTIISYAATIRFQFVYDDRSQIMGNRMLRSWRYIPQYFTEHAWANLSPGSPGNYYRPLPLLWKLINYEIFGLAPAGWHATTLAVHILATLLVYFAAKEILKNRSIAGIASILFGLHPVHIEVVAWVSGVTDSLLTVFLMASFICYLRNDRTGPEKRARLWLAFSLVLYALAILTKITALVMPAMVFAYSWCFYQPDCDLAQTKRQAGTDRLRKAIVSSIPYLAVAAVYIPIRIAVLRGFSHAQTDVSTWTTVLTLPSLLFSYIRLLLWPAHLNAFYDDTYVNRPGFWNVAFPALVVAAVGIGLWLATRHSKEGRLAAIWMVLPIIPVLKISTFVEGELIHDRFLYLPSVGFCLLAALAISKIKLGSLTLFSIPATQFLVIAFIACLLGISTAAQNFNWASDLLLFSHGINVAPNSITAADGLALELFRRGDFANAIDLDLGIIQRDPAFWHAYYSLGYFYYDAHDLPAAERCLRKAIELNPGEATQYCQLGLVALGLGRPDEAERHIRHAIELWPQWIGFHYALGNTYLAAGKTGDARDEFLIEIANNPGELAASRALEALDSSHQTAGKPGPGSGVRIPEVSSVSVQERRQ